MNPTEESAVQSAHAAIKTLELLYDAVQSAVQSSVQSAVRGVGGVSGESILSFSQAIDAVRGQMEQRRSAIEFICSQSDIVAAVALSQGYDATSVAIGEAIRRVNGRKSPESQPLIHALVDLWGQCEAGRALWRERYIKWPHYKTVERTSLLSQSWHILVAALSGVCIREGWNLDGVLALQGLVAPAKNP